MIVVDSNVIAYYWVNNPLTKVAQRVHMKDPDWHAPILWRSELRNILSGYLRNGNLDRSEIGRLMAAAEEMFEDREHLVPSTLVLDIVNTTRLSAYDAEFVALATALSAPLLTADRAVLKAFPGQAITMEAFLA